MGDMRLNGTKEILKWAKRYAESAGIEINPHKRSHHVSIEIVKGDSLVIHAPIHFTIGEDRLIRIYENFSTFGLAGRSTLKALVSSFNELDDQIKVELIARCWTSIQPIDVLKMFYQYTLAVVNKQGVEMGRDFNKKSICNLWWSFGRYRGLQKLFIDSWEYVLIELRRIRQLEERTGTAPVIPITNAEYNPCLTCHHCKVDGYGVRKCKKCSIALPEDLTVEEVNRLYPTAKITNYGDLESPYILHNVGSCDFYKSRIGKKTKDTQMDRKYNLSADNG